MALVRRSVQGSSRGPLRVAEGTGALLASYPGLLEWLTAVAWPDDAPRVTGTVMLFVEDGRWKAWLHDRDASVGCFVSAVSLEAVLAAAERAVAGEGGDWRPDRKGGKR